METHLTLFIENKRWSRGFPINKKMACRKQAKMDRLAPLDDLRRRFGWRWWRFSWRWWGFGRRWRFGRFFGWRRRLSGMLRFAGRGRSKGARASAGRQDRERLSNRDRRGIRFCLGRQDQAGGAWLRRGRRQWGRRKNDFLDCECPGGRQLQQGGGGGWRQEYIRQRRRRQRIQSCVGIGKDRAGITDNQESGDQRQDGE